MITYKDAGVDIQAGEEVVRRIRKKVRSTFNADVLADIGLFGAFYRARFKGIRRPVLVSSVDGVGTKLMIAAAMNRHDSVGQDLVNHCVNDIAVCGARPLFFLDYFAAGKLRPDAAEQIISGFVKACRENRCALIGGETAEMPGLYSGEDYDLAGTIVGVVDEARIIDGRRVVKGDVLVGLPSTGLHTNGYSLARKVLLERFRLTDHIESLGCPLGDALLAIHRSYLKAVEPLVSAGLVHGMSHITGGGIVGNTIRILPKRRSLRIDWDSWKRPPLFELIQSTGSVPEEDMRRTLNLGVGLILVVNRRHADRVLRMLRLKRECPWVMGEIA